MQFSQGLRRALTDADEHGGKAKRPKPTDRPVSKVMDEKDAKIETARQRLSDRFGYSERFEMEEAYRMSMDRERDTGRIISFGRTSPPFPQGAIVRSVKQSPKAWQQRGDSVPDFKRIVPLGNQNCFDIRPGDIIFQLFQHRVPNPKTKQGDTTIVATSTVNGLSSRTKAQIIGVATTANRVTGTDGDNRSNALVAGIGGPIHTGHQVLPAFCTVVCSLTPYTVRGDTPNSVIPAIDEKGQPEDKFRLATHPLDERVVSAMLLRRRALVDKCLDGAVITAEGEMKQYWTALGGLVDDELKGFELSPDDRPTAAYMLWYGIRRGVILAISQDYDFVGCGLNQAILDGNDKFKISREDDEFVASHGGQIDNSQEGNLKTILKDTSTQRTVLKAYFEEGFDKFIESRIDHSVQGIHLLLRRMTLGINLDWANSGSAFDCMVGMGGTLCCVCVCVHCVPQATERKTNELCDLL